MTLTEAMKDPAIKAESAKYPKVSVVLDSDIRIKSDRAVWSAEVWPPEVELSADGTGTVTFTPKMYVLGFGDDPERDLACPGPDAQLKCASHGFRRSAGGDQEMWSQKCKEAWANRSGRWHYGMEGQDVDL